VVGLKARCFRGLVFNRFSTRLWPPLDGWYDRLKLEYWARGVYLGESQVYDSQSKQPRQENSVVSEAI